MPAPAPGEAPIPPAPPDQPGVPPLDGDADGPAAEAPAIDPPFPPPGEAFPAEDKRANPPALVSMAWERYLLPPMDGHPRPAATRYEVSRLFPDTQAARYNLINLKPARDAGLTGRGVRVGVVDNGVRIGPPAINLDSDQSGDYNHGIAGPYRSAAQGNHGTQVAQVLAAQEDLNREMLKLNARNAVNHYLGGIAPGATIVSANVSLAPNSTQMSGRSILAAWRNLSAHGVKLFNNSLGTDSGNPSVQAFQRYQQEYRNASAAGKPLTTVGTIKQIVDQGGLFIFAAGNGDLGAGQSDPAAEALLPLIDPSLQKGFIAVTGLELNQRIAIWADRCGSAADWCMAASGYGDILPSDPTQFSTRQKGTSFSAPQVTGAAALLLERYPWMNNDNLRTTLLTTATDLGERGVDDIYGWGLLDVGRAIQGPAQFAFGDFHAALQRGTANRFVFGNDISGQGGLRVSGEGALSLAGANTYAGNTVIDGGILDVPGSITSSVQINRAGTLTGEGSTGSVTNDGALYNAGKGLTIHGDYRQQLQGTLITDIGAGALKVQGEAALAGRLHIQGVRTAYVPRAGQTQVVLTANEQVSGAFDTFTHSPTLLLEGKLSYHARRVDIALQRIEAQGAARRLKADASQPQVLAAARNLDRVMEALDDAAAHAPLNARALPLAPLAGQTLLEGAAALQGIRDPEVLRRGLYSLSGSIYANAAALQSLAQDQALDTFGQQLGAQGAFTRYQRQQVRWRPSGLNGRQANHAITLGLSQRLNSGWSAAAALNIADRRWQEDLQTPDRDTSRGTAIGLMLGLRQHLDQDWHLSYLAGLSRYRHRVDRHIWFDESAEAVGAHAQGHALQAAALLGRQWQLTPGSQLTPEIGLMVNHSRQQGFTEAAGRGYGLRARAHQVTVPSLVGRLAGTHHTTLGSLPLRLDASLQLRHDLRGRDFRTDGGFAALPMTQARSGQWSLARTRWGLGLGLQVAATQALQLNLSYQGEWSRDWATHSMAATMRYLF